MTVRVYWLNGSPLDGPLNLGEVEQLDLNIWMSTRLIHHTTEEGDQWVIPFSAVSHIIATKETTA